MWRPPYRQQCFCSLPYKYYLSFVSVCRLFRLSGPCLILPTLIKSRSSLLNYVQSTGLTCFPPCRHPIMAHTSIHVLPSFNVTEFLEEPPFLILYLPPFEHSPLSSRPNSTSQFARSSLCFKCHFLTWYVLTFDSVYSALCKPTIRCIVFGFHYLLFYLLTKECFKCCFLLFFGFECLC